MGALRAFVAHFVAGLRGGFTPILRQPPLTCPNHQFPRRCLVEVAYYIRRALLDSVPLPCYTPLIMYQLQNMRVRHLKIVEYMLANPDATYEQISQEFKVSVPWISVIYKSQLFQAKLQQRLKEQEVMTDMTVLDQITGVAQMAMERLAGYVAVTNDPEFLLDTTDKLLRRAGYGTSAAAANVVVNNNNTQVNNIVQVDPATLRECRELLNGEQTPALLEGEAVDVTPVLEAAPQAREVAAG